MVDRTTYEANDGVGGTQLVTTHPGVPCVVPTHVDVFSFELNLYRSAYYTRSGLRIANMCQGKGDAVEEDVRWVGPNQEAVNDSMPTAMKSCRTWDGQEAAHHGK